MKLETYKKILLIFLFIINSLWAEALLAQNISIDVSIDKKELSVGEQAVMSVVISGKIQNLPNPQIPALKEFDIYSSERSQSVSIVNGEFSSSTSFNYLISPRKEGQYTLGPVTLNLNNKTYSSRPINITVLKEKANENPSIPDDNTQKQETRTKDENSPHGDFFIETKVNNTRPFVNEQIILTFAFYQASNLADTPEYTPASTTGFWVEELPPQRRYYKVVSGKKYMVTEIYNAIFPTASGEYTIGPAELKCIPDIFEDPFSLFYGGIRKKPFILKTKSIKITVNPLPSKNIPSGFKGAIGAYNIEATLDKTNTKENEPVTLKIITSGTGNIKTVNDLELPSEIDKYFKQYKTNSLINISKKNYKVYGEKILEFILVPVKSGEISIPSIKFTYFNPEIGRYVDTQTPMFKLNVSPGIRAGENDDENKEKNLPLSIGVTKEDLKRLGRDIRYIKSSPNTSYNEGDYLYHNPTFVAIQILPLLILFGIIGYRKSSEKMETDIQFARAKKAHKFAKNQLKQAEKFLEENRVKEYYAELTRTIQNYLGNKLNLPPASITQELVKNELFAKGINDSVINDIVNCFDKFDLARFAPGEFNPEEMKKMLNSVQNIIISIEKYL